MCSLLHGDNYAGGEKTMKQNVKILLSFVKSRHWDEEYDESLYLFSLLRDL